MRASDAADLALIEAAAREAGDTAMRFFRRSARRWRKDDDSPVTEADIAVDLLLRERLHAARPGYGWLSEESADDGSRLSHSRVFVVDPIDGTRAFIEGREEWVISIAVVENGEPVAGYLLQPPTGTAWSATTGGGARRGDAPVGASGREMLAGARVAGSRIAMDEAGFADHIDAVTRVRSPSLARRLALVADGTVDAAFAKSDSRDWDLAAGVLIVIEAGGRVSDDRGRPVRFDGPGGRRRPVVAAGSALHSAMLDGLAERHRSGDERQQVP